MHKRFVVRIGVETISGVFAKAKARAIHKRFVVRTDLLGKGVETIYATRLGNALKGLREWSRLSASLPGGEGLREWNRLLASLPGGEGLREWNRLLASLPDGERLREWNRLLALLLRVLFGRDKDGDGS